MAQRISGLDGSDLLRGIGAKVRLRRAALGWSRDQLAVAAGVSSRMIGYVESGTTNISLVTLLRLSAALQISMAALVTSETAR